ncbi:MAG: pantoate--beta-alanine ligase [Caldilineales bacterium]|nr:pantoate--beta-alanine ligase [Caldilineales bacterium]MDW8318927.1 pantoate--beta-alanine ligase [Anaerolineae bacterium]
MQVVTTIAALRAARAAMPEPVGVVPTMGFLHEGHLALVRRARQENASVIVTIFVNPTQFGPTEDFAAYPRDLARDLALLEQVGADLVFAPEVAEIYPPGFQTYVTVEQVAQPLEGARRPGHFRGVATVVAKLFNLTQPQRAYFGQKDAQQVRVIQQMTADLNFPLEIVVCPTVREPDGLAMSSRNTYLTPEQRQAAPVLYRSLQAVEAAYRSGERDAGRLRQIALDVLAAEPLAQVEYVSVADAATLQELEQVMAPALVSMAVRIGRARLIDNILLT